MISAFFVFFFDPLSTVEVFSLLYFWDELISIACRFFVALLASDSNDDLLLEVLEVPEVTFVDAVDTTLLSSVKLLILETFKDKDLFFSSSFIILIA